MVKVAVLLPTLLAATGLLAAAACSNETFPFKSYERRLAVDADVSGATRDLKARLPIGSPISGYEKLFSDVGGKCAIIPDSKYPNTMECVYSHGFLVQSEWHCVIKFDPMTKKSIDATFTFYLTGM
jgi:hypothetical protein